MARLMADNITSMHSFQIDSLLVSSGAGVDISLRDFRFDHEGILCTLVLEGSLDCNLVQEVIGDAPAKGGFGSAFDLGFVVDGTDVGIQSSLWFLEMLGEADPSSPSAPTVFGAASEWTDSYLRRDYWLWSPSATISGVFLSWPQRSVSWRRDMLFR